MFMTTPPDPHQKSSKPPLVFIKTPPKPLFWGRGEGGGSSCESRFMKSVEQPYTLEGEGAVRKHSLFVLDNCVFYLRSKSPSPSRVYGRGTLYMKWRAASYMALV